MEWEKPRILKEYVHGAPIDADRDAEVDDFLALMVETAAGIAALVIQTAVDPDHRPGDTDNDD